MTTKAVREGEVPKGKLGQFLKVQEAAEIRIRASGRDSS